jgi:integrase
VSKRRGNNEGSITKRPDGLWEARITLDSGKRKSIYAKTRQEAARRLAAAVRDRDNGALVVADKQSVEQYFNSWLAVMKATIRPRTWETYESYVRLHFLPSLGRMMLTKLTAQQLQLLYAKKLEEGLTTTTVHHLHTIVHKALSNAMRLGLIQRNVCDLIDPPRMRHHEMTTLSEEQARLLLTTASGKRLEALYVLALATGMRQGELLALRWRDVDLDGSTLRVRATLQRTEAGFVFAEPKTAQSRRRIALSKTVVDALRQHKIRQLEERLAAVNVWEDHDLVFPNIIGKPLEAGNVLRRSYWPLLRRAGLPRMRFHDLRHTAATLLLGRGINPKIVSEMLGHSNVSITLTIYSHVTPHMQQQAADAMDAALGRQ